MVPIPQQIRDRLAIQLVPLRRRLENFSNVHWYDFPFGKEPLASREEYLRLAAEVRQQSYPEVEAYEQQVGYAISLDWLHELALHTQIMVKESPLCYAHGRVLYAALSQYLRDYCLSSPSNRLTIWETGTARGFSALCMAKALQDQQRAGTIVTFDVLPHRTKMYWNCIDDLDGPKTRAELLRFWQPLLQEYVLFHQGDTRMELPKIQAERIHFAFLDGGHSYEDVMFEFEQIRERQQPRDMIVFDDYTPKQFPGIVWAVDEICRRYHYRHIELQAHAGRGYVVAVKE